MGLRRFGAGALVVLALGSFVVGCGDDDDDTAAGGAAGGDTELAEGEIPQFTITATDDLAAKEFTFEGIDDLEEGGVFTVTIDNKGGEPHDLQFVRAAEGKTLDDMLTVLESEDPVPSWVEDAAGIGVAGPARSATATLDLSEGDFWYFCGEGSEEGDEFISHARNGMSGELTLSGDTGAELPATDASVTAVDYRFEVDGLTAGENTFTFSNEGEQLHHVIAFPIADGKTLADVEAAFASEEEPTGPPPVDFERGVGTAVLSPGKSQVVTFELEAGDYALVCFMPDYEVPGPPHVAKGMLQELQVS